MRKNSENIYKRKDGRWEGRYVKGRKVDGTILYGSVYGRTYQEVKEKLTFRTSEKEQSENELYQDQIFDDILTLWLENNRLRLKGSTINKYQNVITKQISPSLGKIKISNLSGTTINNFLFQKIKDGRLDGKGGLSPSYVRSIALIINAALDYATQEKMCPPRKWRLCKPIVEKKELSILTVEEQQKLEKTLLCNLNQTKLGILLALKTGMRIGEICALKWEDVDLNADIIRVRHTVARVQCTRSDSGCSTQLIIDNPKTKSSRRDIPISLSLKPALLEIRSQSNSQYVISENEEFLSPRTFEYRYHRILKSCGINNVNFHALRHTFATRCIEVGVDTKSLSEILGHANVSITLSTYVHSSIELKRKQLEKLSFLSA